MSHIRGALMFASLTSEGKFGQINWNKGKEILDMKAIRTVTCFIGKKKKMESKLGLQGPAVFLPEHSRQLHSFERHYQSRTTPSPLRPPTACPSPPTPRFSCSFLSQGPLWWAATLPKSCHQLPTVQRGSASVQVLLPLSGFQPKACPPH